jgi:hypothetical protein
MNRYPAKQHNTLHYTVVTSKVLKNYIINPTRDTTHGVVGYMREKGALCTVEIYQDGATSGKRDCLELWGE